MNEAIAAKRLQGIKRIPTDDEDFLAAIDHVATFYTQNTPNTRRHLRDTLESRHVQHNTDFLQSFDALLREIESAEAIVGDLRKSCHSMKAQMDKTCSDSKRIIAYIEDLQNQKRVLKLQQRITTSFLERFQLSDSELKCLHTGDINDEFFSALLSIRRIHTDRQLLLRTQAYSELSFEIADQILEIERIAFDRLYRWTKSAIASLSTDMAEVSDMLHKALKALETKEAVYQHCIAEIERVRGEWVLQSFMASLQKGGGPGGARAIELSMSDPVRYIGDMLALIHQTIASEYELLHGIFADDEDSLPRLVSNATSCITTPFYDRVIRVVEDSRDAATLFQISNLFGLYSLMLSGHVGVTSPFHVIFTFCKEAAMKQIDRVFRQRVDDLMLSPPIPPSDGSPPAILHDHIRAIVVVFRSVYQTLNPCEERDQVIQLILKAVMDPVVQVCQLSATGLDESNMSVFLLNCLALLLSCLDVCEDCAAAKKEREKLMVRMEAQLEIAVQAEGRNLMRACNLENLWIKMSPHVMSSKSSAKLSTLPGLELESVVHSIRELEASLFTDDVHQMPTLSRIQDAALRGRAMAMAIDAVVNSYGMIYEALCHPENGYGDAISGMIRYSPDQVRSILNS